MKVPMQKQKVQRRNSNPPAVRTGSRSIRPFASGVQSLKSSLTLLESGIRESLEQSPFLSLPFFAGLLAFILLLGLLSPIVAPGRDFRLPGPALSFPQDNKLGHYLLNNGELEKVLTPTDVANTKVEIPTEVPVEKVPVLQTQKYVLKKGEMISAVANRFNLNLGTIISFNDIRNVRKVGVGTELTIPNADGVLYTVHKGDSLTGIARSYGIPYERILEANNLTSPVIAANQELFLPGATISAWELKQALGELFIYPARGYITSRFGYRLDPFTGIRSYHNGVDIANALGTVVRASMEGRVTDMGFNSSYGNYIILSHDGGFQTLYGHLKSFIAHQGDWVNQGQAIGLMGSTGYSTGTHVHFSIFKWNRALNPLNYLF